MGTIAQGDRMTEMILKYRKERPVDPVDREFLDDLRRAAMIPYTVRYGGLYAVSGPICRGGPETVGPFPNGLEPMDRAVTLNASVECPRPISGSDLPSRHEVRDRSVGMEGICVRPMAMMLGWARQITP